jgi:hypothetical protein
MRSAVIAIGLIVVGCQGSAVAPAQPPASSAELSPTPSPKTPAPAEAPAPVLLPPLRRFPVASYTAAVGKDTPAGHAVAFRPDGSLVAIGQGEAERWARSPHKKLAAHYPHLVASLDARGTAEWVRTLDTRSPWLGDIASGPDGAVIATGAFTNKLRIAGKVVARSAGRDDVYVARFERDGTLAWVRTIGGAAGDLAYGIAVDDDGTSYVVGMIGGEARFGALTARHVGGRDVFVASFAPDGTPRWVRTAGGAGDDTALAAVLTPRALCVTGGFNGVATFQHLTLTMAPEQEPLGNPSNVFVACLSRAGDVLWGERLGAQTWFDRGWDLAAMSDGSLVVTGEHSRQAFVARYSADGALLWQRLASGSAAARAVAVLPGDEVLVAMYLNGDAMTLSGLSRTVEVRARAAATVLTRYTSDGEIVATGQLAGAKGNSEGDRDGDELEIAGMAVSPTGQVALIGRLWGEAVFEAGDLLIPSTGRIRGASGRDLVLVILDALR